MKNTFPCARGQKKKELNLRLRNCNIEQIQPEFEVTHSLSKTAEFSVRVFEIFALNF